MSEGHRTNPNIHLRAGDVIDGRFQIEQELGAGGFATVYRAKQLNIHRPVAIKVLNIAYDRAIHDELRNRFFREACVAAQIEHPNVVTIHDYGIHERTGRPYIVMELLRGHDLEHELRQNGPMGVERAVPLFGACLDALALGHRQNVVHKDLKPSNIYLSHAGERHERMVLLDYGIAGIAASDGARLTATGQVLGTPQYLAPEYVQHQAISPALDVYQMGLILVETLSGSIVVDDDNPMRCMLMHATGELEVPQTLLEGRFGEMIRRALAYDPADRFAHGGEFSAALACLEPGDLASIQRWKSASPNAFVASADCSVPSTGPIRSAAYSKSGPASESLERQPIQTPTPHLMTSYPPGHSAENVSDSTPTLHIATGGHSAPDPDAASPGENVVTKPLDQPSKGPREDGRKRLMLPLALVLVAGVLVLVAGVAVVGLLMNASEPTEKPVTHAAVRVDAGTGSVAIEDPQPAAEAMGEDSARTKDAQPREASGQDKGAQPREAAASIVKVAIRSNPDGATVARDKRGKDVLGTTPFEHQLVRGHKETVYLLMRGRTTQKLEITSETTEHQIDLPRKTRKTPSRGEVNIH